MKSRAPILVGLMLTVSAASLSWFVVSTSKDKFDEASTTPYVAHFSDASGIRWKTRVQINGIDVGKIGQVTHGRDDDGRLVALVELRILKDYRLHQDASLRKAAESLLGDFRLDLTVGNPEAGVLEPGGRIKRVQSTSDMEEIQSELKQVAKNVNKVTDSFSRVLSGPEAEGSIEAIMHRVERSMEAIETSTVVLAKTLERNDQRVDGILANLNKFSATMANATSPAGDLGKLSQNLASLSARLDELAGHVTAAVAPDPGKRDSNSKLQKAVENLTESIGHLHSITRKIDEGTGTVGKLIGDDGIATKLENTIDQANSVIGGIADLQTEVELRTEYGVPFEGAATELTQAAIKNTLALRIRPRPDKYYLLEAISDPRGRGTRQIVTTTVGETTEKKRETTLAFNAMKFSAQFAKRYSFLTLRFGIIENTGGLGLDFHAFRDTLELRVDLFDFDARDTDTDNPLDPRIRATLMYEFYQHLWLQAGIDDPLNDDRQTWFFGGVLRFSDDDLKSLLAVAPSP